MEYLAVVVKDPDHPPLTGGSIASIRREVASVGVTRRNVHVPIEVRDLFDESGGRLAVPQSANSTYARVLFRRSSARGALLAILCLHSEGEQLVVFGETQDVTQAFRELPLLKEST
jgi:hypothetical protein